jgi:hypothetical protein
VIRAEDDETNNQRHTTERTINQSETLITPTILARVHILRHTNMKVITHVVKAAAIWFGPVPPMPMEAVGDSAEASADAEKFIVLQGLEPMTRQTHLNRQTGENNTVRIRSIWD